MNAPIPSHRAFTDLADDVAWFIEVPELRLMHIGTTGTERPIALHQLALSEGHPRNRSPFFVLEDAHFSIEPGWIVRAERMAVIHEERRALLADEGLTLHTLEPLVHGANELATFGWQLAQCLKAQRDAAVLQGIVVVLAPGVVEDSAGMVASIVALTRDRELTHVRFIVLELGYSLANGLEAALGAGLLRSRCEVSPDAYRHEHLEAMKAAAHAPVGAAPEQLAGFASPKDVVPPDLREVVRTTPLDPEILAKATGDAAPTMGPSNLALRQTILNAAVAAQGGDAARAVELQEKAARSASGLPHIAFILELILATYQMQAQRPTAARKTLENVAKRAESAELFDIVALSFTGLGATLASSHASQDVRDATWYYTRAGEFAEKANEPILAIECYRMAGQLAARTNSEDSAMASWKRALGVASASPPDAAALSSAPRAARSLAKILLGHGSHAAAATLLDQADDLERGASASVSNPVPVVEALVEDV